MPSEKKLNIVALTNHCSGFDALSGLNPEAVPVSAVLTSTPEMNEKSLVSGAADVSKLGIPVKYLSSYNMKQDIDGLTQSQIDVLLVMGYQRLVPDDVIKSVRLGAFGFHGSSEPLPKGRGRSPINWELIRGRKRF